VNKYVLWAGLILLGAVLAPKIKMLPVVGTVITKVGG
jgi:hypothetical protein